MADIKLKGGSWKTAIDKDAVLTNGSRAAGDVANASDLHVLCDAYLTVQYDTGPPTAGASIAELYVLRGNGEVSQVWPVGGDGTVGNDVDPQATTLVGIFESRQPSLTVNEILIIEDIPLGIGTDRFVVKNISGNTFDQTWQLDIKTKLAQN